MQIGDQRFYALAKPIGTQLAVSLVFIVWDAIKLDEEEADEHNFRSL